MKGFSIKKGFKKYFTEYKCLKSTQCRYFAKRYVKYGLAVLMRILYKFSHSLGNDYPQKAIMGQGIYTTGFG